MTEILQIAQQIQSKITLLEKGRLLLSERADAKATTMGMYDKKLAVTIMKLKNGVEMTLEDETIKDPPTTIVDKIARGICYQEKIDMELATAQYKNATEGLSCIQAELNGLQSKNKYLSEG